LRGAPSRATRRKFEPNAPWNLAECAQVRERSVIVRGAEWSGLPAQEAMMMKPLTAAVLCFGILYVVDAMYFDGWYFAATNQAFGRAWALNWR